MTFEEIVEYALSEEEPIAPTTSTPKRLASDRRPTLTHREGEVAALVARGSTNRQIAQELSISEHTVANHVAKSLRKLEFDSRSQLTAWVVERRMPP